MIKDTPAFKEVPPDQVRDRHLRSRLCHGMLRVGKLWQQGSWNTFWDESPQEEAFELGRIPPGREAWGWKGHSIQKPQHMQRPRCAQLMTGDTGWSPE